jgi:hypothetical protein
MCHFATTEDGGGRVCTVNGDKPFCKLCPKSPTYWRNTAAPAARNPWDGRPKHPQPELDMTGWHDDRVGNTLPCILCDVHTTWISPKGTRCHPSCARNHLREQARRHTTGRP